MTVCIYDGENFLVDKVIMSTVTKNPRHSDEEVSCFFEADSKLVFPDEEFFEGMAYGNKVKMYTIVGNATPERNIIHALNSKNIDMMHIVETSKSFPSKEILNTDSTHLFVCENQQLISLKQRYDRTTGESHVFTWNWTKEKLRKVGCVVHGMTDDWLVDFELKLMSRKLTALEYMVLSQAKHPELGSKFDHWNSRTGKLVEDITLSERQRDLIMNKVHRDMCFKQVKPVEFIRETES